MIMYGLVNKAIEDLICEKFGEDKWDEILADSNIDIDGFISMDKYDDSVTYDLVGSVSKILEISPADVLVTFGHFWTTYTAKKGYDDLLSMTGSSVEEFLMNIDDLHTRVTASFPDLVPPKFKTIKIDDNTFDVEYYSEREGLASMVIGLLTGIGDRFDKKVDISQSGLRENDGHDTFRLTIH